MIDIDWGTFTWDMEKERRNVLKHGINFIAASEVFRDPERRTFVDMKHSSHEKRFYCVGKVEGGILTVRFTYREHKVRIIGAGFWRKGRQSYETKRPGHAGGQTD